MQRLRFAGLIWIGLMLIGIARAAAGADTRYCPAGVDSSRVVLYDATDFHGRSEAIAGNWPGGGYCDQRVQSMRVPRGFRVTVYRQPNYQGAGETLTGDWNPGPGAAWVGQIRSIRVHQDNPLIQPRQAGRGRKP
jgi:hypothetical protein